MLRIQTIVLSQMTRAIFLIKEKKKTKKKDEREEASKSIQFDHYLDVPRLVTSTITDRLLSANRKRYMYGGGKMMK